MTVELAGKVAVVTGSTRSIGAAMAQEFAREGAKVVVTGRAAELGEQVVAEIAAAGGAAAFCRADMTDEAQVAELFRFTLGTFGRLDILVNNHAPVAEMLDERRDRSITETTSEDWEYLIRAGLTSIYYTSKYAIPLIIDNGGGSIINISSGASTRGTPGAVSAYTAMKGAINAMTRQLAADYGKRGVRVNTVVLGVIVSNERMEAVWCQGEFYKAMLNAVCVDRLGRSEDVAHAAVFLASDKSGYITGNEITVDGGQLNKLSSFQGLEDSLESATTNAAKSGPARTGADA